MSIKPYVKCAALIAVTLIIWTSLFGTTHSYNYKEIVVPETVKLSPRLRTLFEKTKVLCLGRFAIEVPQEAKLIWGAASFPSEIELIPGGIENAKRHAEDDFKKLKRQYNTAEISFNGPGPVVNSWQVRFFEDKYAKEHNSLFFSTYVSKGDLTFILGDAISEGETESTVINRQLTQAKSIRLRADDEIPIEPGFCIPRGFMSGDAYGDSEKVYAGIYLPSLPDITFSISSNQNAYVDYDKAEFEAMRATLSLLSRIADAQKIQGVLYPKRDVLREGKRSVQHWKGEESLILRPDGTHDFEWAFVGTPRDVANPSEFHVSMFTKVEHNMVGAAKTTSVSNDEAVALWDRLLSGLKFRIKVPGAPDGSYFLPEREPTSSSQGER